MAQFRSLISNFSYMKLHGKCALVTGASTGIGLGIATALDQAGTTTIIVSKESPQEVKHHFDAFTQQPQYIQVDLSTPEAHTQLAQQLAADKITVDILVNNAGIQHTAPVTEFSFDKWQKIIAINLSAAFYLTSLLLPNMQKNGFGRIINIASVHGLVASTNKAAYVAAKHGLMGLTKVIALENAGNGVTCNAICPGFVHTKLLESQITEISEKMNINREEAVHVILEKKQPSQQFVTVEQLGQAAVFLASDAAAQITGTDLSIDGGWTAQ